MRFTSPDVAPHDVLAVVDPRPPPRSCPAPRSDWAHRHLRRPSLPGPGRDHRPAAIGARDVNSAAHAPLDELVDLGG